MILKTNKIKNIQISESLRLLDDESVNCNLIFPEAAVRSQKQAESEDCDQVDIEHFEKILPQLVSSSTKSGF